MTERRYYIHDWSDEVVPCDCTLEGWAAWLAAPDPEWNRPTAAADGDTFLASEAEIVEIECKRLGDRSWIWDTATEESVGAGATYYLRHSQGGGWWADNSGDTIGEALAYADDVEVGQSAFLAAMVFAREVELRFDAAGPAVVVVHQVGRA